MKYFQRWILIFCQAGNYFALTAVVW